MAVIFLYPYELSYEFKYSYEKVFQTIPANINFHLAHNSERILQCVHYHWYTENLNNERPHTESPN